MLRIDPRINPNFCNDPIDNFTFSQKSKRAKTSRGRRACDVQDPACAQPEDYARTNTLSEDGETARARRVVQVPARAWQKGQARASASLKDRGPGRAQRDVQEPAREQRTRRRRPFVDQLKYQQVRGRGYESPTSKPSTQPCSLMSSRTTTQQRFSSLELRRAASTSSFRDLQLA